jgi:RNA polymerase sigma factor (sigma-70 family)
LEPIYIDIHKPLVDRCRAGDSKAQYELYRLYAKSMFNVCMRIVNHVGEAEDILQDSFIEAFENIASFRSDSTFGAWLKRIVVNRSINSLKKRRLTLVEEMEEPVAEPAEINDEDIQWEVQRVRSAIQSLPDGYRLVLSLYLLEGYDHAEIAQVLNITESTSKSQYNRAKAKARELLINKSYER